MLEKFFYPASVCIVGASAKHGSIGYEILNTIKTFGYTGQISVVNPKQQTILGFPGYVSVNEVPYHIDLAIIVVPKQFVEETVDQLLAKQVTALVLITAGFRETGSEGAEIELRLAKKVKTHNARMVGPNCMGLINCFQDIKLNATFVAETPVESGTAFLSQSGALGAAVLNSLRQSGIAFSHFLSVGNKADVNENDALAYWQSHDRISSIAMYLESFSNGREFLRLMTGAGSTKPVAIVKAGRGSGGMRAASSHTGALGASDAVVDAVCEQYGIMRARTTDEMFQTLQAFEQFPVPEGSRVAVLTNAGGPAILAVDAMELHGLILADITDKTKATLREIVHPAGSILNPVDLLPGGTAEQFALCAKVLAADENVDAVISLFVEPVMVKPLPVVEAVQAADSGKPIYQVVMPLPEFWDEYNASHAGRLIFRDPAQPAAVIANLLHYKACPRTVKRMKPDVQLQPIKLRAGWASYELCTELLRGYNLPFVNGKVLNVVELEDHSGEFAYPVVLKGLAEKVSHKSEFNFVKINVSSPEDLIEFALEMLETAIEHQVKLRYFLVQPVVNAKFELLIGGFNDPSFGPMVMFGSGGKYVETLNDISMKSAYLSDEDITAMIAATAIGKILHGVRGESSLALDAVKQLIRNAAQLLLDYPDISELDLNPVMVRSDGTLLCVDARILI